MMAGDRDADERGVRDRDVDVAQPPQLAKSVEYHVLKVAAPPCSTALAEAARVA